MLFWTIAPIISYAILTFGAIAQLRRVIHRQSSADISFWDIGMRTFSSALLLAKFISMGTDGLVLTGCQGGFLVVYLVYVSAVIKYHRADTSRRNPPG